MTAIPLGRMQNPVRGLLHGSGAVCSVFGLVALLDRSSESATTAAGAVYGVALITMYVTSALYHSVPWSPQWKARFQTLDHIFIYVLVAGTLTPLLVATHRGPWLILGLTGIWGLVALGLTNEVINGPFKKTILPLQFIAGFLVATSASVMFVRMDRTVTALTLAGGAIYLLGTYFFVKGRPRLRPGVFSHHEFFHVVVIIASVLHFVAVWRVISQ